MEKHLWTDSYIYMYNIYITIIFIIYIEFYIIVFGLILWTCGLTLCWWTYEKNNLFGECCWDVHHIKALEWLSLSENSVGDVGLQALAVGLRRSWVETSKALRSRFNCKATVNQWIGLRDNLNRKPSIFLWNMGVSGQMFPLNQPIEESNSRNDSEKV